MGGESLPPTPSYKPRPSVASTAPPFPPPSSKPAYLPSKTSSPANPLPYNQPYKPFTPSYPSPTQPSNVYDEEVPAAAGQSTRRQLFQEEEVMYDAPAEESIQLIHVITRNLTLPLILTRVNLLPSHKKGAGVK